MCIAQEASRAFAPVGRTRCKQVIFLRVDLVEYGCCSCGCDARDRRVEVEVGVRDVRDSDDYD